MLTTYSRHLFKLLLALLLTSAFVMFVLAYRTTANEKQFHLNLLTRSTDSTAREIELYIGSLQRALRIFAMEERELLTSALSNPLLFPAIEVKIELHFPENIAFALSDPQANEPIISEPELFGDHCQSNLSLFGTIDFDSGAALSLHSAGPVGTEHFDLMIDISSEDRTGILFISIEIDVLKRLMSFGSSDSVSIGLYEDNDSGDNIVLLDADTHTMKGSDKLPSKALYSAPIAGTPWVLFGSTAGEAYHSRNATILQSLIGAFVLLFAGLTAWRSIEQEKVSRNRTVIVLENVEAERKRIARELHDQVLSDVSHAKRLLMDLGPESGMNSTERTDILLSARNSVEEISDNIRSAIDDLYPHTLENLGLFKALESYAQNRCRAGQTLHFQSSSDIESQLRADQKLHIYRIVAELISNALTHSECTILNLGIEQRVDGVVVYFGDNGNGFNFEAVSKHDRHGLSNIESRTASLNATAKWVQNDGTCFELIVPV